MPKIQSKKQQRAMDEYLSKKFAELARGQELIPVVLDRATWEGIVYSINLALKLKHKEQKRMATKKETVKVPAIKEKSGKVIPAPSIAYSHEEIEKKAGRKKKEDKRGFLLSSGEFAGRKKAAKVAESAGEVPKKVGKKLHSHDLREAKGVKKAKESK